MTQNSRGRESRQTHEARPSLNLQKSSMGGEAILLRSHSQKPPVSASAPHMGISLASA